MRALDRLMLGKVFFINHVVILDCWVDFFTVLILDFLVCVI